MADIGGYSKTICQKTYILVAKRNKSRYGKYNTL